MLKRGALIVLAVFLSAASPIPQSPPSQPPVPSAVPPSSAEQSPAGQQTNDTHSDERGSRQRPLVVETHPAPQSEQEAQQDASYQQQRAAIEDAHKLTVTTLVIGIGQTAALFLTVFTMAYVAVRQLRAYIYPDVDGLTAFSLTGPIKIRMNWRNAGKTPARDFECNGIVWINVRPLHDKTKPGGTPKEPDDTSRHSKTTVYPGQDSSCDWDSIAGQYPIPQPIIDSILAGTHAIYVVGAANYRDVFGFRHKTEVCVYISLESVTALIETELKMRTPQEMEVKYVHAHILNNFT